MLFVLGLLSSCAMHQDMFANGKTSYTKEVKSARPFAFGNPSWTEMAKEKNIKEVISVEKDYYFIVNITTLKGN